MSLLLNPLRELIFRIIPKKLFLIILVAVSWNNLSSQIINQPSNISSCEGDSVEFVLFVRGAQPDYQWQDSIDGIWNNISDDTLYNGTSTDKLEINQVPSEFHNQGYRCILIFNQELIQNDTSDVAILFVTPLLEPLGEIIGKDSVCFGEEEVSYFANPIQGAEGYTWTVPNGSEFSETADPAKIDVNYGTSVGGMVKVVCLNKCSRDSSQLNIHVIPNSFNPTSNIIGDTIVCFGYNRKRYSIPSISQASGYSWIIPSGSSIEEGFESPSILVDFNTSQGGIIRVFPYNVCFNGDTSQLNVEVIPDNVGNARRIKGETELCYGSESVGFHINPVEGATNYIWDIPAGSNLISGEGTHSISIDLGTTTAGTLSVTPENLCFSGESKDVELTIYSLPEALELYGKMEVCLNEQDLKYWIDAESSGYLHSWSIQGGNLLSDNHPDTILVNWDSNPYRSSLFLTRVNLETNCSSKTTYELQKKEMQAPEKSKILKKQNSNVLLCMDTSQILQYRWGFTDRVTMQEVTIDEESNGRWHCRLPHEYNPQNYWYWLETVLEDDEQWECVTTSRMTQNIQTSAYDYSDQSGLRIYPNPASNYLYIDLIQSGNQEKMLTISDMQGKIFYSKIFSPLQAEILLDLKTLSLQSGVYMISIQSDRKLVSNKLVIN